MDKSGWLEHALEEERKAVNLQLELRHQEMLRVWSSQADSVELEPKQPYSGHPSHADSIAEVGIESEQLPGERVPGRDSSNSSVRRPNSKFALRGSAPITGLTSLVQHHYFDIFFTMLIVLSAVTTAVNVQYSGLDVAHVIEFPSAAEALPAEAMWPGAQFGFELAEGFFGVCFTIELLLKMVVYTVKFPYSFWNIFDSVVMFFWYLDYAAQVGVGLNPMFFRLARLARVMRLVKLMRHVRFMDSLQLLVSCIMSSGSILLWSSVVLGLITSTCTLALCYMVQEMLLDPHGDLTEQETYDLYRYFGSFTRGMLSMMELTLGNWVPITRMIIEHISEWWFPILMGYNLCVNFAVVKVMTGVFLHETFKVANGDDDLMIIDKDRQTAKYRTKMMNFLEEADTSGDGTMNRSEFLEVLKEPRIQTWLEAMELEVRDPEGLWEMLDDGDHEISQGELIASMSRLKGTARNLDLVLLHKHVEEIHSAVRAMALEVGSLRSSQAHPIRPEPKHQDPLGRGVQEDVPLPRWMTTLVAGLGPRPASPSAAEAWLGPSSVDAEVGDIKRAQPLLAVNISKPEAVGSDLLAADEAPGPEQPLISDMVTSELHAATGHAAVGAIAEDLQPTTTSEHPCVAAAIPHSDWHTQVRQQRELLDSHRAWLAQAIAKQAVDLAGVTGDTADAEQALLASLRAVDVAALHTLASQLGLGEAVLRSTAEQGMPKIQMPLFSERLVTPLFSERLVAGRSASAAPSQPTASCTE